VRGNPWAARGCARGTANSAGVSTAARRRTGWLLVAPGAALSRTERRVLRLLAGPLTEREIGAELYLTRNTVHTHVAAVYRKLGVASRPAAVSWARELGLLGSSLGRRGPPSPR
jgi:LuxR family maltose regulon positive regulatory protein